MGPLGHPQSPVAFGVRTHAAGVRGARTNLRTQCPLSPTGHSACLGPRAANGLKPGRGWRRGWSALTAAVGDRSAAWEGSRPQGPASLGGPGRQPSPVLDRIKGCFSLDREGDLTEN